MNLRTIEYIILHLWWGVSGQMSGKWANHIKSSKFIVCLAVKLFKYGLDPIPVWPDMILIWPTCSKNWHQRNHINPTVWQPLKKAQFSFSCKAWRSRCWQTDNSEEKELLPERLLWLISIGTSVCKSCIVPFVVQIVVTAQNQILLTCSD